jgi:hypothetical protein
MDDMALIEKLANETQLLLSYFEQFLRYNGMSISSKKCAYQFQEPNSTFKPTEPITGWGKVPIYGPKLSYKYLGYFIHISLDFSTQHKEMLKKLKKACNDLVCDHWLPLHEAITYVNSDLVFILKYRMYLVTFSQSLLDKFDTCLASAVKLLSAMPRSTTTDLLLEQGLQNVYLLQSTTRAQFLQNAVDAPDPQCRQSSRIMHSQLIVNLSSHGFEGKSPFSQAGLAILNSALQIKRVDLSMPPLFKGVRSHLIKTFTSLQINLNHLVDSNNQNISSTLRPLAQDFLTNGVNDNMTFNFSSPLNVERFTNLFQSLEDSLYAELAEISPLFERQTQSNDEMWMKLKGISHATPNDMLRLSKNQMMLPDLLIRDSTSKASRVLLDESHMELLSELIAIFTYHLLMPFRMAKDASIETPINWSIFAKHSINGSTVFVDGSCSNRNILPILAGFEVFIPHQLNDYVSTSISYCGRIPRMQTIEQAEAFAILAALLLSTDTGPITINSDCQKLVNTINRYKLITPKPHEVIKLHDRSLILRILNDIQFRRISTSLKFLRIHVRLEKPLKDGRDVNDERLRSCIEYGKEADKKAKESLSLTNISVPDETKFRSEIGIFIHSPIDDATTQTLLPNVFENNTTELYNGILKRTHQHYFRKGNWHQYMLASSIWQETSFSILHTKRGLASLKRFLIHILARTLPTYHRLNLVRAKL